MEQLNRVINLSTIGGTDLIKRPGREGEEGPTFARFLQDALQQVNTLQKEADQAAVALASGNLDDLHNLLIKTEKAQLSLQLTVQVVNKAVEAYKEISRMQI